MPFTQQPTSFLMEFACYEAKIHCNKLCSVLLNGLKPTLKQTKDNAMCFLILRGQSKSAPVQQLTNELIPKQSYLQTLPSLVRSLR